MDVTAPGGSSRIVRAVRETVQRESAKKNLDLPMLPRAAALVMGEVREPSCNAARLSEIIEKDPVLTARILKTANSAYFAGISEITSLPLAVGRLGSSMVVAVTMGSVSKDVFRAADEECTRLLERSWERSVTAAAAALRMASAVGMNPDECFTIGLLHSIGEPVLVAVYAEALAAGDVPHASAGELAQAIHPLAPFVGGRLLEEWGLPALVYEAVRHQRAPEQAPQIATDAAAVCGLAAQLAERAVAGASAEETIDMLLATRACALVKVARNYLAEIVDSIGEDAREFGGVFGSASA